MARLLYLHRTKGPLVQRGLSREQRDWGIVM